MQMAHAALNAVVALLCCAPGMSTLSRKCCTALCQAGIAQPLIGLLSSGPDDSRCSEVCLMLKLLTASVLYCAAITIICLRCWQHTRPSSALDETYRIHAIDDVCPCGGGMLNHWPRTVLI